MARSPANAVIAAVVIGLFSIAAQKTATSCLRKQHSKKRGERSKRSPSEPANPINHSPSEPDVLLSKLFGDDGRMCVVVEAGVQDGDSSGAADRETQYAVRQLFVLCFTVTFSIFCFLYGVATGSFMLAAASFASAGCVAPPAAADVHKYWGRALDEALSESIKTTTVPWDLAII